MTTSGKLLLRELLIRRFKCDLVILIFVWKSSFSFTFHGFYSSIVLFLFRFLFSYLQKFSRVSLTNGESATDQHIGRSWVGRLGRHGDWRCKFQTKTILRRNNFGFMRKSFYEFILLQHWLDRDTSKRTTTLLDHRLRKWAREKIT